MKLDRVSVPKVSCARVRAGLTEQLNSLITEIVRFDDLKRNGGEPAPALNCTHVEPESLLDRFSVKLRPP